MNNYHISASTLDLFNKIGQAPFVGSEDIYTVENFLADLSKPMVPTEAMRRGTAFHALLANREADFCKLEWQQNGYRFSGDAIAETLCDFRYAFNFEVKIRKNITYSKTENIILTGIADCILGNEVHEFKTTSRYNFETYYNSVQWKVYLYLFEADLFFYRVFVLNDFNAVTEMRKFYFSKYQRLSEDVEGKCREMLSLLKLNNAESLIWKE